MTVNAVRWVENSKEPHETPKVQIDHNNIIMYAYKSIGPIAK